MHSAVADSSTLDSTAGWTSDGLWGSEATCVCLERAEALYSVLLDRLLAAWVQVLHITSAYVWQGQRATDSEKLLLIKPRQDLYQQVEATLGGVHPCETPEVVCLPILAASVGIWIGAVTQSTPRLGG